MGCTQQMGCSVWYVQMANTLTAIVLDAWSVQMDLLELVGTVSVVTMARIPMQGKHCVWIALHSMLGAMDSVIDVPTELVF